MPDDYLDALKVDPEAVARSKENLANVLAAGHTPLLVGEVDGEVAGFVNLGPDRGLGGGHVFAIYVLPETQSRASAARS